MLLCGRILDNLPLVVPIQRVEQQAPPVYQLGFYMGFKGLYAGVSKLTMIITLLESHPFPPFLSQCLIILQTKEEKSFLNNHLSFTVKYHKDLQTDSARIVGFEVNPYRLVLQRPYLIVQIFCVFTIFYSSH